MNVMDILSALEIRGLVNVNVKMVMSSIATQLLSLLMERMSIRVKLAQKNVFGTEYTEKVFNISTSDTHKQALKIFQTVKRGGSV